MRIGLNLLYAMPEVGGSWNYIENLLAALKDCDQENQYIAFVTAASERLAPVGSCFSIVHCPVNPRSRLRRVLFENTMLQMLAGRHRLDCMHWFANTQAIYNRVPAVVTVYDLHSFFKYANYSWVKRLYLHGMMRLTANKAPMLLPMSQATADDLHCRLAVDPKRMTVIKVILEKAFQPVSADAIMRFKLKHDLPEQFWLYVAHSPPHKNHARLLQAYYDLKSSGYKPWPLVLRGDALETSVAIRQQLKQGGLESDVIFLPRLERSELPALYSAASALVYPSLYEGGGIPVVEAIACGCPVIASPLPPIKEFIGEAALYFDPLNVKSMADSMLAFERSADMRQHYQQIGFRRAENFRAERIIPVLLDAYRRVAGH